jgi:hypothetical protein
MNDFDRDWSREARRTGALGQEQRGHTARAQIRDELVAT